MGHSYSEAREYSLGVSQLYSLSLTAVNAIGTHLQDSDVRLGVIYARASIPSSPLRFLYWIENLTPIDRMWQELIVNFEPTDAQQTQVMVTARFPSVIRFSDITNRNMKHVHEFYYALDYIIDRQLRAT